MLKPFRKLVKYTSSKKGAKITLTAWIIAIILLSVFAPSGKEYEVNSSEGSVKQNMPSEIAQQIEKEEFPSDDGLTALLVFHRDEKMTKEDRNKITELSEWLQSENKPKHITNALPFHMFPENVQDQMFSEDQTTLLFHVNLEEGIESSEAHDTLEKISDKVDALGFDGIQFEITGPAGISADTITLFKNGDFVLMLATIALIFIILLLIYRSPLLAITPLIIAGIVYAVVDRLLGVAGDLAIFSIDSSAVSIMLVLLFAVLTDYSLFVFSRYREELQKNESKYEAMSEAMYHVAEPIFFSGGTIFLAMLTLFVTVFEPYNHFAPVFSIAVIVIAFAGLTLIPSMFALMGRKAFWPFIPKIEDKKNVEHRFWGKIGGLVKKHPIVLGGALLITLLFGAFNIPTNHYSFNLLKSFPDEMSSRIGFEILEENYPAGQLAPVTALIKAEDKIETNQQFLEHIQKLTENLEKQKNIDSVSPKLTDEMIRGDAKLPANLLSEKGNAVKLQIILKSNPYEEQSLHTIKQLRNDADTLLVESGLATSHYNLHYGGQSAKQLDVKEMNQRDMMVLFTLVIVLITLILGFQTHSILLPIIMVGTILLSYVATLGFSWLIFEHLLGLDSISYRWPVYTFVFMIALGIDYNIMLVSRIRELANHIPWKEAVAEGVAKTGGVISSAGLILAATFSVLMTQPLQELYLFGFTMALGILLDTFLIRGILLPAILILTHRQSVPSTKNM